MFLTWDNQADADTSLAAINSIYNCTYEDENGYIMAIWDTVTKSNAEEKWGFIKPKPLLGKTIQELEAGLIAGYAELSEKPSNWDVEGV